ALSQEDVVRIHNWILSLSDEEDDVGNRSIIPDWQANELAAKDLLSIPKSERANFRYLSLTQMYNAKRPLSVIRDTKAAIDKALNSLSTRPELIPADYIDDLKLIVRYNINDYGWDPKHYEDLVSNYPYQLITVREDSLAILQKDTSS